MVYTIVVHLYAKPEAEAISKLKAKLVEASSVYSQDKETLSWFVMQDVSDERKFTIVERYLNESVCIPYFKSPRLLKKKPPTIPLCCFCEMVSNTGGIPA
jgi:quinol monooxygenase YgiN